MAAAGRTHRAREAGGRFALRLATRLTGRPQVAVKPGQTQIVLEQPPSSSDVPRWGHGRPWHPQLTSLLAARRSDFAERIGALRRYAVELSRIPRDEIAATDPCWRNPFFSGIDGASLYVFLRERRPARYLEVGSGFSTRFAARAKRDGGLRTEIVSIDPEPRAEIDALCDRTLRARVEDLDLSLVEELAAGDVMLFDGSHRVFMNNDVSVFWLDIVPRLPPGVLVGVHDILLPEDYFPENAGFYWSEQYMLAVALLFGPNRLRPVLPCHFVCVDTELKGQVDATWDGMGLQGLNAYGNTFWFEITRGLDST